MLGAFSALNFSIDRLVYIWPDLFNVVVQSSRKLRSNSR